jgi:Na+/H+-translocating membrane pyrophosphatase
MRSVTSLESGSALQNTLSRAFGHCAAAVGVAVVGFKVGETDGVGVGVDVGLPVVGDGVEATVVGDAVGATVVGDLVGDTVGDAEGKLGKDLTNSYVTSSDSR